MNTKNKQYYGFVVVAKDKDKNINDLYSIPLLLTDDQISSTSFDINEYIREEYKESEIVFLQNYTMIKNQIVSLMALAKTNGIDLEKNKDQQGYIVICNEMKESSEEEEEEELISIPLIFTEDQVTSGDFHVEDYVEDSYNIVFLQSYNILKEQLLKLKLLAKQNNIEIK